MGAKVALMQSIATYFGLPDASHLAWAHRINTSAKLAAAVKDASLHVIEADIHFGPSDATPLVADGAKPTDLDAATFLSTTTTAGKGVKLDFHAAEAVAPTLAILRLLRPSSPVILHADIFALLAGKNRTESMEPEEFIRACQLACPHAVLSLGWSLKRSHDADGRVEDAIIQQLSAMVLQRLGPVSYGVEIRAGYTPGLERGAALILDPLEAPPRPASHTAPNIVDLVPRLRRVA